MDTTEMKMLRWIQGKTRGDRTRNEKFWSDAMVKPITTVYVTQKRLSWYGHVMGREYTSVAKQITVMEVGGKKGNHGDRPRTGIISAKVSKKWGLADIAACECGEREQTADHITNSCPLGLHRPTTIRSRHVRNWATDQKHGYNTLC